MLFFHILLLTHFAEFSQQVIITIQIQIISMVENVRLTIIINTVAGDIQTTIVINLHTCHIVLFDIIIVTRNSHWLIKIDFLTVKRRNNILNLSLTDGNRQSVSLRIIKFVDNLIKSIFLSMNIMEHCIFDIMLPLDKFHKHVTTFFLPEVTLHGNGR